MRTTIHNLLMGPDPWASLTILVGAAFVSVIVGLVGWVIGQAIIWFARTLERVLLKLGWISEMDPYPELVPNAPFGWKVKKKPSKKPSKKRR